MKPRVSFWCPAFASHLSESGLMICSRCFQTPSHFFSSHFRIICRLLIEAKYAWADEDEDSSSLLHSIRCNQIIWEFVGRSRCWCGSAAHQTRWGAESRERVHMEKETINSDTRLHIFSRNKHRGGRISLCMSKSEPDNSCSTVFPLVYLHVHAEPFDNACDGEYVILQQLAGQRLDLDRAMFGLETCCHLLFDPEGLLQQHSQCPILTAQTTFQDVGP